jgi:hypothetical protein
MAYYEARRISRTSFRQGGGSCPNAVLAAALWQFALVSYVGLLLNLNPLMEFDEYYVLSDLAERLELLYGLSSVLYVAFSAALVVALYRLTVQGWLSGVLPGAAASALAWALAALVVALAVAGVMGQMRGVRTPAPGR